LEAGNHASRSYFLAAALFSAPETMFTTRYGRPSPCGAER
jgi:hypothetical protein